MSEPAPPRVLIVEDDGTIVANLVEYLEARGLAVDSAHDGAAAMARLSSDTYDVIVLDLGLPRADGLHVLQHLRRRLAVATPVLVLTARDALASKAEAFSLGADDYVVKPFALAEIDLRIRALHRRAQCTARRTAPPRHSRQGNAHVLEIDCNEAQTNVKARFATTVSRDRFEFETHFTYDPPRRGQHRVHEDGRQVPRRRPCRYEARRDAHGRHATGSRRRYAEHEIAFAFTAL